MNQSRSDLALILPFLQNPMGERLMAWKLMLSAAVKQLLSSGSVEVLDSNSVNCIIMQFLRSSDRKQFKSILESDQ